MLWKTFYETKHFLKYKNPNTELRVQMAKAQIRTYRGVPNTIAPEQERNVIKNS